MNKMQDASLRDSRPALRTPRSEFIRLPGMLLIGSANRNSGKTEFACAMVRRFAQQNDIVGLKVTAIRQNDGSCPRGGKGCGVCSSLQGPFCITEETNPESHKDTARLLAAGADRVFWLRVMIDRLPEGVAALLDIIGPDAVTVCESNSLRAAVRPGLFFMLKSRTATAYKASAGAVKQYADRTVVSDGNRFDMDCSDIRLVGNRWVLREQAAAIVLAGGDSTRMGQDKSMLPVQGQPLIAHICDQLRDHFDRLILSANEPHKFGVPGLQIVPDRAPGQGPLMGIASALHASAHELNFVTACDLPRIDITFVHQMLAQARLYDVVVPRTRGARLEPLFAVYRKPVAGKMDELLAAGERRIRSLFAVCRTAVVDLPAWVSIANLNTRKEYLAYAAGGQDGAL